MKKILIALAALFAVAVVGFVGAAMMQPDTVHIERSLVMNGTPADAHPYIADFKLINQWSPWEGLDPNQVTEYSDPTGGEGAWYTWKGNDQVGEGKLEMTKLEPLASHQHLTFIAPWQSEADVAMLLEPVGEDKVKVTWTYDQQADFATKAMGLFMSMEDMLGGEYEKGLGMLKPLVEKAAADRVAEEQAKAEEAARAAEEAAASAEGSEGAAATEGGM